MKINLSINKDSLNALRQGLGDAVMKELDKAATEALTGVELSRENWGVSPLSNIFGSLGFSATIAQTEIGSRAIAEAAHYEYERAVEERRRDSWVVDWNYSGNRTDYLYWYSYRTIPSRAIHIGLRDELDRRRWEVTIDDLFEIESAFREFQRYLIRDNVLEYEQANYFIEHSLARLRVWGIDALEYQNQHFNQDIHTFRYRQPCNCPECRMTKEDKVKEAIEFEKASNRAKELLLSCLDSKQKRDFLNNDYFTVKAKSGRKYRITRSLLFNVKCGGNSYCAGPKQSLPIYDRMLAQKCLLETDEKEFLRIANRS